MKRLLLNSLMVLSLIVCIAAAVLWVRGYWYVDVLAHNNAGSVWIARLGAGEASLEFERDPMSRVATFYQVTYSAFEFGTSDDFYLRYDPSRTTVIDLDWRLAGLLYHLEHHTWNGARPTSSTRFGVSYWLIVLLTLLLPIWRIRWSKRKPPGFCPKCNYDLRATPDRCPECGTLV